MYAARLVDDKRNWIFTASTEYKLQPHKYYIVNALFIRYKQRRTMCILLLYVLLMLMGAQKFQ